MAKKHLFISIGSTSTNALAYLLDRLSDLGIYRPQDAEYKDMFIAIDTDEGPLEKLSVYNQGEISHVFGINFKNSCDPDVFSHNFLENSYRPDWSGETLKILASQQGVGGCRSKSFATLEWRDPLSRCMDSFFQNASGPQLLNDYVVFLVSSAWGGTASGLFQNVSDFIASKLYEKSTGHNFLTPFYTVLSLPNYAAAKSIRESKGYQGLENFAYFMRSVQQAGWRGSLQRLRDTELANLNFIFPEFCDLKQNGTQISVQSSKKTERFCGTDSPLPQRAIVMVPTMSETTTAATVAEQLFLLGYLDVLNRPLDNTAGNANSRFVDIRRGWASNSTNDCPVLIGINMVECQYPKDAVITRTIESQLIKEWNRFFAKEKSSDMHVTRLVKDFIGSCISIPKICNDNMETVFNLLEEDWTDSATRIANLKNSIQEYRTKVQNEAFEFPRFENAEDLLSKMVEYMKRVNDDARKKAFNFSITLGDIRDGYVNQLNEWYRKSKLDDQKQLNKILKMIDYTVTKFTSLSNGKNFNNYISNYCNGKGQIQNEFMAIARDVLKEELLMLQEILLTKAIVVQWKLIDKNEIADNVNWKKVNAKIQELSEKAAKNNTGSEINGFIKTVYNDALADALKNDIVNVTTKHCIDLMKKSAQEAELQACFETLRRSIRQQTIDDLNAKKIIKTGNVNMITLHDSKLGGCCPNFYEQKATASMIHFYAKSEGATDITWKDVKELGFSSFFNLKKTSTSELSNISSQDIENLSASMGTWTENNVIYPGTMNIPEVPLYGMWFGSVDIGLKFRDVLDKVYTAEDLKNIQTEAENLENPATQQQQKQCCQTLFEKVAMGAIFGIINDKVKNIMLPVGKQLSISLKTPAGEEIWSKTGSDTDLGLIADGTGMNMNAVSAEQIKILMSWMRRNDAGSSRFAKAFDCEGLFTSLLNQERYVLTEMKPTPNRDQAQKLVDLYQKIQDCVTVTVL